MATSGAVPRATYTIDQAREALGGVSRDWLYSQIRQGTIRSIKIGGRRFIPAAELDRIAAGAT